MNVAEIVKEYLETLDFIDVVNIDYMENTPGAWGLYTTSESVYKEYITGNTEYLTNLTLYYHTEAVSDIERINNISVLSQVVHSLNQWDNFIKITCSNPVLFSVPVSLNDGYTYQIQIQIIHI